MTYSLKSKGLAEFIGTFFLVITIFSTAVAERAADFAPVAIGVMLMVMIYALGYISGAHFNPAVSIGLFVKGDCSKDELPVYLAAQIFAGILGGLIGCHLLASNGEIIQKDFTAGGGSLLSVIAAEAMFTFALIYVILNVATEQDGNQFYGLAIGFTVMAGAFAVGSISLGSFNPAVTTMLLISGKLAIADCWLHFLPQIVAAVVAVYTHKVVKPASN